MGSSVIELLKERWVSDRFVGGLLRSLGNAKPDAEAWFAWDQTGRPPFVKEGWGIKRNPARIAWNKRGKGFHQIVQDADRRHRDAMDDLEKAKAALSDAEAKVEVAEAERVAVLSEHLAFSLRMQLSEVFMFGPAYELLRIIGPQLPLSQRDDGPIDSRANQKTAEEKKRAAVSRRIVAAIDCYAGNEEFDEEIRAAIEGVCERYRELYPRRMMRTEYQFREGPRDATNFNPLSVIESYRDLGADDEEAALKVEEKSSGPSVETEVLAEIFDAMDEACSSAFGDTFAPVELRDSAIRIAKALDRLKLRKNGETHVQAFGVS